MVRGLWTQRSGAGSRGEDGPNAPMVLGTKRRRQFSRARSSTLWRPRRTAEPQSGVYTFKINPGNGGEQTCDVDLPCQRHVRLAHGAQQGAVVHQPRDPVIYNQFSEKFVVQHVGVNKRASFGEKSWRDEFKGDRRFKGQRNKSM